MAKQIIKKYITMYNIFFGNQAVLSILPYLGFSVSVSFLFYELNKL